MVCSKRRWQNGSLTTLIPPTSAYVQLVTKSQIIPKFSKHQDHSWVPGHVCLKKQKQKPSTLKGSVLMSWMENIWNLQYNLEVNDNPDLTCILKL